MTRLSGFAEAAALNTHDVIETPNEPRNYDPKEALNYLMRGNITKFHYHGEPNNGVWAPQNIQRGQILRCDLPTDYDRDGYVTLSPRNLLCLGVDVDPKTLQPIAVRALRFSYNSTGFDPAHELLLEKGDPEVRYGTGNTFSKDAVLRTGSAIDIIPFNSVYWGHFIDTIGTITPEYMPHIEEAIERGYANRKYAGIRNYAEINTRDSLSLSALDPDIIKNISKFLPSEQVGYSLLEMDAVDQEELCEKLLDQQVFLAHWREDQIGFEKNSNRSFQRQRMQKEAEIIKLLRQARRDHKAEDLKSILTLTANKMADYQKAVFAQQYTDDDVALSKSFDIFVDRSPSECLKMEKMPTVADILAESAGEIEKRKDLKGAAIQRIDGQKADQNSIEKLADFGIGGLAREPDINLHEYMWLGRYHMLRIPSLINQEAMDDLTNRPCALTRAWVRPDDNGDLHISHMAFVPCTRGESKNFKYKMKTKPLDTTVKKPTMLISEMEVIVPVNAENFQPNQPDTGTFYELLPHQVDAMLMKRELARGEYGELQYHGMRPEDIPEDCHEVTLPEPPNEKLRKKFENWGIARFVGGNKAPVKRSMRGSHYTARSFDDKGAVNFHQSFLRPDS